MVGNKPDIIPSLGKIVYSQLEYVLAIITAQGWLLAYWYRFFYIELVL